MTSAILDTSTAQASATIQPVGQEFSGELLSLGSQGDAVAQVQNQLGISADGDFGPQTESGVRSFQAGAGLVVDAVVGPLTWDALFGTSASQAPAPGEASASVAAAAISIAEQQIGKPYLYGGSGPDAFDCSGLIQYAYAQIGVSIPRTTYNQFAALRPVSRADAHPGDVIFFLDAEGQAYHDGLYAGNGQMIVSRHPGTYVQYQEIWTDDYRIGRV
ncbi:C40 family peptidase [Protofrankia symbiont of Coriaria ruscifolia]|uniref:C40 family peptidase n=1 Tax=Protofrankia symbiont of Coriaria ruscifolia TaxID=1306542 RepID=UPI0013EF6D70|nr:NlpC/P60 family protein [Protofrankia symbiont of Coriaria ruscifolia]